MMYNRIKNTKFTLLFMALILFSCGHQYSPERFHKWVKNNPEFQKEKVQDGYFFQANYLPKELMILREYGNEISPQEYDLRKTDFDSLQYFSLKIGAQDKQNNVLKHRLATADDYHRRIEYFVAKAQDEFYLQKGEEYVKCQLYHFERYYNSVPYDVLMLGFPNFKDPSTKEKIILKYFDKVLGLGQISFEFESQQLYHIPKLNL